ncbi:hypothetical protein SNE32_14355, partial [Lysobacter sp. D1-1-M9]|uniref:hypothetical protein n=1 Tax=Novilysobacter longmucuonensis TaxID=3098603 RepID=UPI002FCBCF7E
RRKPMICSSEKRFFTSNLLVVGDWTPDRRATQKRGDVAAIKLRTSSANHIVHLLMNGSKVLQD